MKHIVERSFNDILKAAWEAGKREEPIIFEGRYCPSEWMTGLYEFYLDVDEDAFDTGELGQSFEYAEQVPKDVEEMVEMTLESLTQDVSSKKRGRKPKEEV